MAAEISVQDPSGSTTIRPGAPLPSLHNIKENEEVPASMFDVYETYARILNNEDMPMPLAAVLALTELIGHSNASTMQQLLESLQRGAAVLKSRSSNPLSLTAGCDLFIRYVTSLPQDSSPRRSFEEHKAELVRQGRKYAQSTAATCRDTIAQHTLGVIKDDSIILTHSYSRVVMHALLHAHRQRRISVYVTEARPRGLGMKTYEALTAAGIPCTVVLDSAVAYVMDKVDLVLVGSEAVVESGGLINAVGSFQAALIAKAAKVPFYALAESYKFLRLFPLSQHDLPYVGGVDRDPLAHDSPTKSRFRTGPTETQKETEKKLVHQAFTDPFLSSYDPPVQGRSILPLPAHRRTPSRDQFNPHMLAPPTPSISRAPSLRGVFDPSTPTSAKGAQFVAAMTKEQLAKNPEVDYTTPDLISLVFTDVGILTPEGVSQFLVGIYAD